MKQLDVDVSPPASYCPVSKTLYMPLCMYYIVVKFQTSSYNTFWDMNFYLVWIFVKWQTDRQKVMHKSPPCIRTGGLKNIKDTCLFVYLGYQPRFRYIGKRQVSFIIDREEWAWEIMRLVASVAISALSCLNRLAYDLNFRHVGGPWP